MTKTNSSFWREWQTFLPTTGVCDSLLHTSTRKLATLTWHYITTEKYRLKKEIKWLGIILGSRTTILDCQQGRSRHIASRKMRT